MNTKTYIIIKRITDILISGISLVLLSPFLLVISVGIKLSSHGPILFRQVRVGQNRKAFTLVKFRSMQVNAENTGPHFTIKNDTRVTSFGRVLRNSKLDELPSLLNVMKGDMSLVGPRPMVPEHVNNYRKEWDDVFSVKPGITDYATIHYRDEENHLEFDKSSYEYYRDIVMPKKMELIFEYLERRSLLVDLKIFIATVWLITFGRIVNKIERRLFSKI